MTDYETFCRRYGIDPALESSRAEYREAEANLRTLHSAAAKAEAQAAIDKAKRH